MTVQLLVQNEFIAERLREAASLLEEQGANRFRVNAYRKAADTVESLPHNAALILRTEGLQGLTALPGIGPLIGAAIAEMIRTGQWSQLERLRGALDPEVLQRPRDRSRGGASYAEEKANVRSITILSYSSHPVLREFQRRFAPAARARAVAAVVRTIRLTFSRRPRKI